MNLGYEALRKQFRASTGVSMGQYAIGVRVNRAKALLLRSNLPLEKLALQWGIRTVFLSASSSSSTPASRPPSSGG